MQGSWRGGEAAAGLGGGGGPEHGHRRAPPRAAPHHAERLRTPPEGSPAPPRRPLAAQPLPRLRLPPSSPRPGPLHLPPAAASSRSPRPAEPPAAPRPLTHFVGQLVRHAAGHRGRRKRRQQRPPARFKQRRRRRVGARGGAAPDPVRRGSGPGGLCLSPGVAPSPGPGAR